MTMKAKKTPSKFDPNALIEEAKSLMKPATNWRTGLSPVVLRELDEIKRAFASRQDVSKKAVCEFITKKYRLKTKPRSLIIWLGSDDD